MAKSNAQLKRDKRYNRKKARRDKKELKRLNKLNKKNLKLNKKNLKRDKKHHRNIKSKYPLWANILFHKLGSIILPVVTGLGAMVYFLYHDIYKNVILNNEITHVYVFKLTTGFFHLAALFVAIIVSIALFIFLLRWLIKWVRQRKHVNNQTRDLGKHSEHYNHSITVVLQFLIISIPFGVFKLIEMLMFKYNTVVSTYSVMVSEFIKNSSETALSAASGFATEFYILFGTIGLHLFYALCVGFFVKFVAVTIDQSILKFVSKRQAKAEERTKEIIADKYDKDLEEAKEKQKK